MPCKSAFNSIVRLLLLTTLVVMALFSCSNDTEKTARKATGAETPAYNGKLFTINYRPQWTHQAQFAGVYMAYKKGFYRNYGLNVNILPGGPEFPAYESLQYKACDVTQLFLITAITRDAEHNNLVNLAQISQKSALMLVGKKSRGLNSVKDMNNKTIGLWRTDFRDLSLIFIKQNNLNMKVVNVDFTIRLLLNDGIDLMNVMRYNEYHQILQTGMNPEELFTVDFSETGVNIVEDGLYCTHDYFDKYPVQCRNFAEATMDGWLYAINHQQETIDTVLDIMRRHHLPANRPHQAWMLNEMRHIVLNKSEQIGKLQEKDFNSARELLITQKNPVSQQSYRSFYANAD